MHTHGEDLLITILAFGQIAERLGGRTHHARVEKGTSVRELVEQLDLHEWISFGLSVAINGQRCEMSTTLETDVEVALLPPVSGG